MQTNTKTKTYTDSNTQPSAGLGFFKVLPILSLAVAAILSITMVRLPSENTLKPDPTHATTPGGRASSHEKEAIQSAGVLRVDPIGGSNDGGWKIPHRGTKKVQFSVTIRYERPELLTFASPKKYVKSQHRGQWGEDTLNHGPKWVEKSLDLSSEEVYFFAWSLDSQKALLKTLVSDCLSQTTYNLAT